MDEATSSLDEEIESKIMESIDLVKGKKTILISAHRKKILKRCDVIYEIEDGKIKNFGPPEKILQINQ